ncbi:MAG: CPBP family intramembrane glutamic endopeptidase [Flavobacteriaceae bacterium]
MNSKKLSSNKIHIIILIIGVLLIIQMFSGAVGYILNEIDNSDFSFTSKLIALDVCFWISEIVIILILIKLWKVSFNINIIDKISMRQLGLIILISLSAYFIENIVDVSNFLDKIIDKSLVLNKFNLREPIGSKTLYFTDMINTLIMAPIIEEMLFRKLFFNKLKTVFTSSISIIITSILFSAMHLNLDLFLVYFLIGVMYTYIYHLTGSLTFNILLHFFSNLMYYFFERSDVPFSNKYIFIYVCFYILCGVTLYQSLKYLKIQKIKNENG